MRERCLRAAGLLLIALPICVVGQVAPGPATRQVQRPIYVEDSPAAQDLAVEALELRDAGEYVQAAQKLQEIVDTYPHKLMQVSESSYVDGLLWVRQTLRDDADLLSAYRSLFGAKAARLAAEAMPTSDRPVDAEALRDVLSQYTLTRAGLDAGLALGSHHLERAEGGDASGVLDELGGHPDLPEERGRYHLLRGVASLLLGDQSAYATHLQALKELGATDAYDELEALIHRVHPPLRLQAAGASTVSASSLPGDYDKPLWEADLLGALWADIGQRIEVRTMPGDRATLRTRPVVASDRVILNLGDGMIAYDRASGWRQWFVREADAKEPTPGLRVPRAMTIEPRGVCVEGELVYGLLGWLNPNRTARGQSGGGVSLVAVQIENGEERWRIEPGDLDPSLHNAAFDGTPVAGGGRLYTLVKRVRVSGLHDVYLTAVDQADGSLAWRRHLSSSSSQTHYSLGPAARMVVHAGRVYVSDNRGTVLAMDGRTGTMRWVTVLPDAGTVDATMTRGVRTIRDEPDPVVTSAGLLVPPVGSGQGYILLDKQTGSVERVLEADRWRGVRACYTAGDDVLAIGGVGVSLFDGATLETVWHKPLDAERYGVVRGRPAVGAAHESDGSTSHGVVVFTTDRRLIALSHHDGDVLADVPTTAPGHVALASGQVLVATTADLLAYTDWQVAEDHLLGLAEQTPANPRPGMALARLALRTGREAELLRGIDLALGALAHPFAEPDLPDDRQPMVFGMLYDFTTSEQMSDLSMRGELLDRMATTVTGPDQEAAYQLTRAHHLVELGDPGRAVEHYQAVLADPSLASVLYTVGRRSRLAGLEARRRVKDLILAHGRGVYQAYDLLAEHELQQLVGTGEQTAAPYVALADRYPLALSVNRARQYAADRALDAGDVASALRQLQAVYLDSADEADLSQIAGRIVRVHLSLDRPELARHWLRRVKREHPGLLLSDEGVPVTAEQWLAQLGELLYTSQRLPSFSRSVSEPAWIEGQPMRAKTRVVGAEGLHDRVLMSDGGEIRMLSAPGLEPLWRKPVPVGDMRVLAADGRQVLWWSSTDKTLGAMDSQTGEQLWQPINYGAVLNQAGDPEAQEERRTRQQRQFMQILGGVSVRRTTSPRAPDDGLLWAVDLTSIVLADDLGRAACIDRDTGRVRWSLLGQADSLTSLAIGDGLVALGGASWADTAAQHGIVTLLDPLTGEQHQTVIQTEKVPAWLGFADNGLLVSAIPGSLSAHDITTGLTQWRTDSTSRSNLWARYTLGGGLLIAAEQRSQAGAAQVIDVDSGRIVNHLPVRSVPGRVELFNPMHTPESWYVATHMQALSLDPSGHLSWSDAICAANGHIQQLHVSERYALIVSGTPPRQMPNLPQLGINPPRPEVDQALEDILRQARQQIEAAGFQLYLLDRHTGVIEQEVPLSELQQWLGPDDGTLVDGALLLGTAGRTLVIKGVTSAD